MVCVQIRSQWHRSEYALTLISLHPRSVILGSTRPPTPPWGCTFPEPCPTVSLSSARYGAFANHWRNRFCSRSSHHSSCLGLTTAMRRLPNNQLSRLQSAINTAAQLVFSTTKHESVSPLLRDSCQQMGKKSDNGKKRPHPQTPLPRLRENLFHYCDITFLLASTKCA